MKVLLINSNSSLISRSWAYKKFFTPIAPLGLAYIAGVLIKNGIEASIIDQFATKAGDNEMLELIKTENPQVIGFSAMTPTMPDIKRLVSRIRKEQRRIKIVLGNIHATCFPEEVLKDDIADIVVKGEGEVTMLELCQRLSCGKDLRDLAGISFKSDGQIVHNPDRELIEDLDSLPFPYWHLLNLDDYRDVPLVAINNARAFPIMASRGCPYRCYYCSQDKVYNRVRYRNLEKVVDEMEYFSDKFKIKYFGFNDAYFPADEKTGLEFCNLIIKRKLHKKIRWCTETRVDKVTARLLKAMKESGVHVIMYGVEVGNEKILKLLNKNTTLEQARIAFKQTRKAKIFSQGLFILGLPGETVATCRDTVSFAKELDCDFVKFNLAMPYPGSRFFEDYRKINKMDSPEKFTSWFDWTAFSGDLIYTPEGMDSQTLRYLQRKAMFEFYVRPKIIFRHFFRKTISFNNFFYGSIWLVFLLCGGIFSALKRFFVRSK